MADLYDIRSRFETDGIFWDARDPNCAFSAHLSSAEHLELAVSAEKVDARRMLPNPAFDPRAPERMLGFTTTLGACTLIGFHELPSNRYFSAALGGVVLSRRYRLDACIIGYHLESDAAPLLHSAWFTYSGISQWFPGTAAVKHAEEGTIVSFPNDFLTLVDFCIPAIASRIKLVVAPNVKLTPQGRQVVGRSQPRIVIEPLQPRSLEWFIDLARRFENFFSLFMGTLVRLRVVSLQTPNASGWLVAPRSRRMGEKPDLQAWVRCDYSQLARAIAEWFAVPDVFRPLENIVYGAIHGSSLVAETEFLSLAQAIESLHRLTENTTIISPDLFATIFKWLSRVIADQYGHSAIVKRLVDAIRYCNEPSFRDRIQSLISRVSEATTRKVLGDAVIFEQTLRQTRNYFTHPGIKKQSKVLTKPADLFLFNQKLHAFLRLLILLYLGFPETDICDVVQYQSRRWRIL